MSTPPPKGPWEQVAARPKPKPEPEVLRARATRPREKTRDDSDERRRRLIWNLVSAGLLAGLLYLWGGWILVVAGIFGILVHELGHLLAINRYGCGPGRIYFVPFLGGAAMAAKPSPTEFVDVKIALAGPLVGVFAAVPFILAHQFTAQDVWLKGAFFIAFINLLNLAPAPPLDGSKALGPVLARIHPQVERAALIVVGGLAVLWALNRGSFILAAFIAFGLFSAFAAGALRPDATKLDPRQTIWSVVLYLLTAGICMVFLMRTTWLMGYDDPLQYVVQVLG